MSQSKLFWYGAAALALIMCWGARASGAEAVLNGGFETKNSLHWTLIGELPSASRGVAEFDVTGDGRKSWTYYQHPNGETVSGLSQMIHVFAGVTYTVSADICYHNG